MRFTFRFPRVLTKENGTDPKSDTPIRSAIKFATKALKTPYLYVKSSKSYEHTFRPFGFEKKDEDDYRKEENLMKKEATVSISKQLIADNLEWRSKAAHVNGI